MSIRWITPMLGTAPALEVIGSSDLKVIDVRDLVDKQGNKADTVKQKIDQGVASLKAGNKTVICCDYGISRSNAIAAGIVSIHENISFEAAVRKVQNATGEKEIKLEPLSSVRQALGTVSTSQKREKRTVLVTGGSGFVGQSLLPKLSQQFKVIAPSRKELDLEKGNTQLDLLVAEHAVNCVVHLASPRIYTSNVALGATLSMLRNVLDVCTTHKIRLVYPSSWEIFTAYIGRLEAKEDLPPYPKGPYGETKYLAEMLIDLHVQTNGLKCTVLRSSPVYGLNSDKPKFVYNFIDKAVRGDNIVTHMYKNGAPALDLMAIDDLIRAICLAVQHELAGYFNLGTGVTTTTMDIARFIVAALDSKSEIESISIDSYAASIAMNYAKSAELLGWRPITSIEDGLLELIKKCRNSNEQE